MSFGKDIDIQATRRLDNVRGLLEYKCKSCKSTFLMEDVQLLIDNKDMCIAKFCPSCGDRLNVILSEIINCNDCGSRDVKFLRRQLDTNDIYECNECGSPFFRIWDELNSKRFFHNADGEKNANT